MKEQLKQLIVEVVNMHNGYSDQVTEMTCLGARPASLQFSKIDFSEAVKELLSEGKLFRLKFNNPDSKQDKFILFAKGTVIALTELMSEAEQNSQSIVVR